MDYNNNSSLARLFIDLAAIYILTIETEAYVLLLTYPLTSLWIAILHQTNTVADIMDRSLWDTWYGMSLGHGRAFDSIDGSMAEPSELAVETTRFHKTSILLIISGNKNAQVISEIYHQ